MQVPKSEANKLKIDKEGIKLVFADNYQSVIRRIIWFLQTLQYYPWIVVFTNGSDKIRTSGINKNFVYYVNLLSDLKYFG